MAEDNTEPLETERHLLAPFLKDGTSYQIYYMGHGDGIILECGDKSIWIQADLRRGPGKLTIRDTSSS